MGGAPARAYVIADRLGDPFLSDWFALVMPMVPNGKMPPPERDL